MASQSQRSSARIIQSLPIVHENDVGGNASTSTPPAAAHLPRTKRHSGVISDMPSIASKLGPSSASAGKYGRHMGSHTERSHRGTGMHPAYARRFGLLEELYAEKSKEGDGALEAQPLPESDPSEHGWLPRGPSQSRLLILVLLLIVIAIGLGVGLGVGLRKKSYVLEASESSPALGSGADMSR